MLAEKMEEVQHSYENSLFLQDLHQFMDSRHLSIERIPHLGFKELDLFMLYKIVQQLGGYDEVMAQQKWKQVYTMLGAHPHSTSAATSTRRHYEKLFLCFDLHLQEQNRASLKRPRHCSPSAQDEDSLRGGKRSTADRPPNPALTQRFPDISPDHTVRISPKMDNQTLGDPPSYHSLYPNIPSSQTNNQHHPRPYLPTQEQCSLAELAAIDRSKQIGSSSCVEPLNLSFREHQIVHRMPSIAPPNDKKVPKFLNRVLPLYRDWCFREEKEVTGAGTLVTGGAEQTQPEVQPLRAPEKEIIETIDLTTSSDISLSCPPPTKSYIYPQPPVSSTCSPLDITANKTPEWKFPLCTGEGEGPFKLNHPVLDPSTTTAAEIQTLLQSRSKERFGAQSVAMGTGGAVTSPRKQWRRLSVTEPRPAKQHSASEPGFPLRDQAWRSSFRKPPRWSVRPAHHGPACGMRRDGEVVSGHQDHTRWPHSLHRDLRPFHMEWLEAQEYPSIQPTPSPQCTLGPALCRYEAPQSGLRPGALEQLKGLPATTTGLTEVQRGNVCPSLRLHVTPTEYWRLRQLISSSL